MSDIHLDMNSNFVGEDLLPVLIDSLQGKDLDLIIIAGDIGDRVTYTIDILDKIEQEIGVKVLFIPGNHDVWVDPNESSWDSYCKFADHRSSLIEKPYFFYNDYVIVGEMGWFDYSLVSEKVSPNQIGAEKKDWGDCKYAEWGMEDKELMELMLDKIEKQLKSFKDKRIIFVTHFVPYKMFTTASSQYMDWDVCNAFMGSARLGEMLNRYENIEYIIFGHTHERYSLSETESNKKVICSPLGYIAERKVDVFKRELESSVIILDIQ